MGAHGLAGLAVQALAAAGTKGGTRTMGLHRGSLCQQAQEGATQAGMTQRPNHMTQRPNAD